MPPERTTEPSVILDVVFEEGLLFFELSNRAPTPATRVSVAFSRSLLAPDGDTDLTRLAVFRRLPFLAPGKVIRVFVDSVQSYFARRQPSQFRVELTWTQAGKSKTTQISHDIRIYRDLPYVTGFGAEARRGVALTEQQNWHRR